MSFVGSLSPAIRLATWLRRLATELRRLAAKLDPPIHAPPDAPDAGDLMLAYAERQCRQIELSRALRAALRRYSPAEENGQA